jgi:hypothetical protein
MVEVPWTQFLRALPPRQQSSLRTDQTQSPRSTQSKQLAFAVSAISALNEVAP